MDEVMDDVSEGIKGGDKVESGAVKLNGEMNGACDGSMEVADAPSENPLDDAAAAGSGDGPASEEMATDAESAVPGNNDESNVKEEQMDVDSEAGEVPNKECDTSSSEVPQTSNDTLGDKLEESLSNGPCAETSSTVKSEVDEKKAEDGCDGSSQEEEEPKKVKGEPLEESLEESLEEPCKESPVKEKPVEQTNEGEENSTEPSGGDSDKTIENDTSETKGGSEQNDVGVSESDDKISEKDRPRTLQNGDAATSDSSEVEDPKSSDDKADEPMEEEGSTPEKKDGGEKEEDAADNEETTPTKKGKGKKSTTPVNLTPRRSSRNLNKQKSYVEEKDDVAEKEEESDIEEITLVDPLAVPGDLTRENKENSKARNSRAGPNKTIVVNDTKHLVEIASGSKSAKGAKKEPTLVIIDTNSILSGRGPIPATQQHTLHKPPPPRSHLQITPAHSPSVQQSYSVLPVGSHAQPAHSSPHIQSVVHSSLPGHSNQSSHSSQPSHSNQLSHSMQSAHSSPVTPQRLTTSSTITPVQKPPIILPSLTDDMYVVEAPSFIVPYVYEKPPVKSLKDFLDILQDNIKAAKEAEAKAAAEKKSDNNKEKESKNDSAEKCDKKGDDAKETVDEGKKEAEEKESEDKGEGKAKEAEVEDKLKEGEGKAKEDEVKDKDEVEKNETKEAEVKDKDLETEKEPGVEDKDKEAAKDETEVSEKEKESKGEDGSDKEKEGAEVSKDKEGDKEKEEESKDAEGKEDASGDKVSKKSSDKDEKVEVDESKKDKVEDAEKDVKAKDGDKDATKEDKMDVDKIEKDSETKDTKGENKVVEETAKDLKVHPSEKDKDEIKIENEVKDLSKGDESKKSTSYFDNPLGKFFMQIGMNLVQEHVQTDLLRSQKKKRDREGGKGRENTQMAINSLEQTLELSKENNEPFHLKQKKCDFCNFKTESALVMAHHMETPHMRNYLYRCNFCPLEVRSPHDILFHMEAEHNVRGRLERGPAFHQCPSCSFEDNQKGKLTRHLVSCQKRYRPEKNQEPPLDWEPPAKIPRVSRNRPGFPMAGAAVPGIGVAKTPTMVGQPHPLLPKLGASPTLLGQTTMSPVGTMGRGRGRPPMQGRFVPDMKQAQVIQQQVTRPMSAQPLRQGMLYRSSPTGPQSQVLLPASYHIGNQIYQRPVVLQVVGGQLVGGMPMTMPSQGGVVPNVAASSIQNAAGKVQASKVQQQPSISITPLPRQPSGTPPNAHSPNMSGIKPGHPGSGGKATFVICEICDGYIKDLEQLRSHMQWIHKVKIHPKMIFNRPPLNCQKCQFRFFTDQGLERHLLGSHGLVTSSMQEAANKGKDGGRCPVCGRVYQWKLLNHVARDHSMTLKPAHLSYKCTVCTATFGMYKQFENHVYTAHSVVAKRVMEKKPGVGASGSGSSAGASSAGGGGGSSSSSSSQGAVGRAVSAQRASGAAPQGDSLLKPLKINDEITIIPQPARGRPGVSSRPSPSPAHVQTKGGSEERPSRGSDGAEVIDLEAASGKDALSAVQERLRRRTSLEVSQVEPEQPPNKRSRRD